MVEVRLPARSISMSHFEMTLAMNGPGTERKGDNTGFATSCERCCLANKMERWQKAVADP